MQQGRLKRATWVLAHPIALTTTPRLGPGVGSTPIIRAFLAA